MGTDSNTEAVLTHQPCEDCGSSDALAIYSDGHTYCHKCEQWRAGDGERKAEVRTTYSRPSNLLTGEFKALNKRKLTEETCRKFGYRVRKAAVGTVHLADMRNQEGEVVSQHVRPPNKDFYWINHEKNLQLFGQHLWRNKGKMIVVTEGELDTMTVSQLQGHKWPVVSITSGVGSAVKDIQANLSWLEGFDEVIFMFDMDEPGQEAAKKCAALLKPGTAKIARLDLKDASDMHQAGRDREVIDAIWEAKEYRPDGILSIDDIMDDILKPVEWGLPWFLDELTKLTYGRRLGETYAFGAGTGVGKTDWFMQQLEYDVNTLGETVGAIFLEQEPAETGKRAAGKFAGRRFHIPNPEDGEPHWTQEELKDAAQRMRGKVFFYDNWGETDWNVVKTHIRFMAHAQGIRIIYLDHLTAMADAGDKERGSLEIITKEMAMLAKELSIIIMFVSHLTTPEGKPHEEGGRVMIRHFKGSRSIGFWSHFMFGLERDQQNENLAIRTTTILRCLKDRYTGNSTGETILLGYDATTSRLFVRDDDPFADPDSHGFTPVAEGQAVGQDF